MENVVNELFRPARKNFERRHIRLKGLNDLWQADLAEFIPYAKTNKQFKYILVVINCFSKFLWLEPIKNKSASEVTSAMEIILKRSKISPNNLQTDMGKEFYNASFKNLMKKYGINHYSTFSTIKAAHCERVIRTIKTLIYKMFSLRGKYVWYDKLQEIAQTYNSKVHSTIKMKPKDVSEHNEKKLLNSVYRHLKVAGRGKFRLGDIVRISKYKSIFEKGYTPSWTTELFKIIKIQITNPVTYLIEDMNGQPIKGAFYEQELQKTSKPDVYLVEKVLRKKGDKIFVKWLGFNSTHNSWINKSNLL